MFTLRIDGLNAEERDALALSLADQLDQTLKPRVLRKETRSEKGKTKRDRNKLERVRMAELLDDQAQL